MTDDTQSNEPAKADGQPDTVTRNVMPMADVRLCLEEIDNIIEEAELIAKASYANGWNNDAKELRMFNRGVRKAKSILLKHTKDRKIQREFRKANTEPSA